MEHKLSIWRSLRDWRRTCVCDEMFPCRRFEQQTGRCYEAEAAKTSRAIPAINPDMDQP